MMRSIFILTACLIAQHLGAWGFYGHKKRSEIRSFFMYRDYLDSVFLKESIPIPYEV